MNLSDRWHRQLEVLEAAGRLRTLKPPAGIDFSSNDYLGYGKQIPPAASASDRGSRSGIASRLLRGHHPIWEEVEAKLAAWHGAAAALVMTSGYVANEGLLSTLIEPGDTVFSDQYNHASIIDGLRLSKAEKIIFPHNDLDALETAMRCRVPTRGAQEAWFVVTESLFGMEGDTPPLQALADLAERYRAHLIVDEAHATGCFGVFGSGIVDAQNLRGRVLATVHTGGKALAVPGAYIAGSRQLKDLLVNRCRHLIYTTALPPIVGTWWLETLERVRNDNESRVALADRVRLFRGMLAAKGIVVGGSDYIASIMLGADARAVDAAQRLQDAGFDVRAIRPPTVPEGTARLRVSIHADHDADVLRSLAGILGPVVAAKE